MPYITLERRRAIADGEPPVTAGELNFALTMTLLSNDGKNAIDLRTRLRAEVDRYVEHHGLSYQTCNDAMGALDCARRELERRGKGIHTHWLCATLRSVAREFYHQIISPYEDKKILENGDIRYVVDDSSISGGTDLWLHRARSE